MATESSTSKINKYRVAAIRQPTDAIKVYRLEPTEGNMATFVPGQFVMLHMLDDKDQSLDKRPYSIASSPSARYIELCIKMIGGRFTSKLERLRVGDTVGLEVPTAGHFVYEGQERAAFIAGGTGIAPFVSMLRHISDKKLNGRFILFYSTKTAENILYQKELSDLAKKNPNIKIVVTLTQECAGWKGEKGRINSDLIKKYIAPLSPAEFNWWICGQLEMVKCIRDSLTRLGVDPKSLRIEGWG